MARFSVVFVFGLVCTTGCGGKSKQAGGKVSGIPAINPDLCDTKGKRVETYDLNEDGKPDVWKLYARVSENGTDVEVLTCKQIDYDRDGEKDYVATYEKTGELVAESIDLTFDGKFDAREHFDRKSGRLVAVERDSDHDKKPDVWEDYTDKGMLKQIRVDRNGDSKPDLWEQYANGVLVAILYDDDFDNKIDRKENRTTPPKATVKPPGAPDADDGKDGADKKEVNPADANARDGENVDPTAEPVVEKKEEPKAKKPKKK
jgi:hypothetical protein